MNRRSKLPQIFSAALSPQTRAAAIPSEKSPVAMRLLFELSFLMKVNEHNSVAATITLASGFADAILFASEIPATPPAQPSPHNGILVMFWFSLSLFTTSASILGVERPVLETKIKSVTSSLSIPHLSRQAFTDSDVSSEASCTYSSFLCLKEVMRILKSQHLMI